MARVLANAAIAPAAGALKRHSASDVGFGLYRFNASRKTRR